MASKNITLSVDEKLLGDARKYAASHGKSLNQFVRELLATYVAQQHSSGSKWLDLVDQSTRTNIGRDWKREDLYD